MGLAPYGKPRYKETILKEVVDLKEDGSIRLDMSYFDFLGGLRMTNAKFSRLFDGLPRRPETPITQREMDLAASIQLVTEEIMLRLARFAHRETGQRNLCLAGGVALNCVANGKLLRSGLFEDIWIQPAAGDAGGALGAALFVWFQYLGNERTADGKKDFQRGSYLGPEFKDGYISDYLMRNRIAYRQVSDEEIPDAIADLIANQKVVGWYQGRMEFGPRALGGRSIVGDPRSQNMQSIMNLKIKYRESFRPFAPVVLAERVSEFFEHEGDSPYMLIVAPVREALRTPMTEEQEQLFGIDKLNIPRSSLPAITHVDYSARIQTVHEETNPGFAALLREFDRLTGCPVLVNTSFNVRGEPVVCSPDDAYRCFVNTEMDYLAMGNFLLKRSDQPHEGVQQKFHPVPD